MCRSKITRGEKPAALLLNLFSNLAVTFMFSFTVSKYLYIKNSSKLSVMGITFSVISERCFSVCITKRLVGFIRPKYLKHRMNDLPVKCSCSHFLWKHSWRPFKGIMEMSSSHWEEHWNSDLRSHTKDKEGVGEHGTYRSYNNKYHSCTNSSSFCHREVSHC